jgi:hypothetical protein
LERWLADQHIKIESPRNPLRLSKGSVSFLFAGAGIDHKGFLTDAWVRDPLKIVLSAIEGFRVAPRREHLPARLSAPPQLPPKGRAVGEPPVAVSTP